MIPIPCLSYAYPYRVITGWYMEEIITMCATAISAKSAQIYPKKLDTKFALFAVCAHSFHTLEES